QGPLAGGGRTEPARGDRVPALLAAGGARPLHATAAAGGPQVPAAAPGQLRLPVAGGVPQRLGREGLVRPVAIPRRGGLLQALLRGEDRHDVAVVLAPGAGAPRGRPARG